MAVFIIKKHRTDMFSQPILWCTYDMVRLATGRDVNDDEPIRGKHKTARAVALALDQICYESEKAGYTRISKSNSTTEPHL